MTTVVKCQFNRHKYHEGDNRDQKISTRQ